MKVSQSGLTNVIGFYQGKRAAGLAGSGWFSPVSADQADISQKGKDLQSIMASLKALPDVRGHLVSGLRRQVATGTYKANSAYVAAGMQMDRRLYKEAVGS